MHTAFAGELLNSLSVGDKKIEIFQTVASEGKGIVELAERLFRPLTAAEKSIRNSPQRLRAEAKSLLQGHFNKLIDERVSRIQKTSDLGSLYPFDNKKV